MIIIMQTSSPQLASLSSRVSTKKTFIDLLSIPFGHQQKMEMKNWTVLFMNPKQQMLLFTSFLALIVQEDFVDALRWCHLSILLKTFSYGPNLENGKEHSRLNGFLWKMYLISKSST